MWRSRHSSERRQPRRWLSNRQGSELAKLIGGCHGPESWTTAPAAENHTAHARQEREPGLPGHRGREAHGAQACWRRTSVSAQCHLKIRRMLANQTTVVEPCFRHKKPT